MGFPDGSIGRESACNAGDEFNPWEDPVEKEMETHASILAWEIPWTEEPGRLQSMGSQELDTTLQLHHHHHRWKHAKQKPWIRRDYCIAF